MLGEVFRSCARDDKPWQVQSSGSPRHAACLGSLGRDLPWAQHGVLHVLCSERCGELFVDRCHRKNIVKAIGIGVLYPNMGVYDKSTP